MPFKYLAMLSACMLIISGLAAYNYVMRTPPATISKVIIEQSHDTLPVRQPSKAHVETID